FLLRPAPGADRPDPHREAGHLPPDDPGSGERRHGTPPFLRPAGLPEPRRLPDFEQLPGAARPSGGTAAARRRHLRGAAAERQGRQGVGVSGPPGPEAPQGHQTVLRQRGADRRDRGAAGGGRPPDPLRLRGHLSGDA
ncbi:Zonula occludens toxin, partial [Dysosmobacter welbionis]